MDLPMLLVDISKVTFRVYDEETDGKVAGRHVSVCCRDWGRVRGREDASPAIGERPRFSPGSGSFGAGI
jgi:hypothetical protein